jgi:hypothetical protein
MKTGTSGSVSSISPAEAGSIIPTHDSTCDRNQHGENDLG